MVHSGEIVLGADVQPLSYDAHKLLDLLRGKEDKAFQFDFTELSAGIVAQPAFAEAAD
jgi:hypothetical protein